MGYVCSARIMSYCCCFYLKYPVNITYMYIQGLLGLLGRLIRVICARCLIIRRIRGIYSVEHRVIPGGELSLSRYSPEGILARASTATVSAAALREEVFTFGIVE